MLLAKLGRFQEAYDLCETVPGERAMNFQMMLKSLVEYQAPNQIIADAIMQLDNSSRQTGVLEDESRSLGYQNRPSAVMELGEMLNELSAQHRALYWSGVAMGLSWHGRKR